MYPWWKQSNHLGRTNHASEQASVHWLLFGCRGGFIYADAANALTPRIRFLPYTYIRCVSSTVHCVSMKICKCFLDLFCRTLLLFYVYILVDIHCQICRDVYCDSFRFKPQIAICIYVLRMYICVGNLTIIGSDSDLPPGRRQAIIWTKAGILSIGTLVTNSSEMLIEI